MTDGGTFNGQTVTGLGIAKVARIYYDGSTTHAHVGERLRGPRQRAPAGVHEPGRHGRASPRPTASRSRDAVAAVEMSTDPRRRRRRPTAPACAGGQSPTNLFFDDLENTGQRQLDQREAGLVLPAERRTRSSFDATYATSGDHELLGRLRRRATARSYSIAMNSSVAIPAGSSAFLRFNHAYGFEDDPSGDYDGGVLEYSTNSGVDLDRRRFAA